MRRNVITAAALVSTLCFMQESGAEAQDATATTYGETTSASSSGVRLGGQARIDASNLAGNAGIPGTDPVPIVTAGVRMDRLFAGLGLGFAGHSDTSCSGGGCDMETTNKQWALTLAPLVSFDLLVDRLAALYLLGWLNLTSVSDTTVDTEGPAGSDSTDLDDGSFRWGLNVGAGVRGHITEGLSIGTEWGWGFLVWYDGPDSNADHFRHGIFGTLVFEATLPI